MALFESYDRRIDQINKALNENGISSIEEAKKICDEKGIDPYKICESTQNICFENAKWAYVVGAAIAIKKGCTKAADAAEAIGIGLQAFCIPGTVADDRKVGLGHGNLAAMLLREETECFAFLAGHESFAAAEGAIKIAEMANKVRVKPLRVILNGLGKDAAFGARTLTFPSQVTPQTRQDSSTRLQVHTRRKELPQARSTSLLLPVVVQVVHCIRITWLQVRLPTV